LKKESYPLNKTIEKAFDSTQKLVLEIDLKSEDAGGVQTVTIEKGINRDRTLQQNVSRKPTVSRRSARKNWVSTSVR
jgi:hypothetical protein